MDPLVLRFERAYRWNEYLAAADAADAVADAAYAADAVADAAYAAYAVAVAAFQYHP
jgi:hypothetical protein